MHRFGLVMISLLQTCLLCQAQLSLNGRALVYDSRDNQYVCTVPDSCFGSDWEATLAIADDAGWSRVEIDGTPLNRDERICFRSLDGITAHSLTATRTDGAKLEATLLFSCLPLLEVNATLSASYKHGTFVLHHPDSLSPLPLQGRIKWRGNTTMMASRHKRNFHIKLEDEQGVKQNRKLLGLRDDNSWLLDAGQADLSRIRNHVAHQLWLDMSERPYYADREPKARGAVRGQVVELFVNGQYEGIYTLSEAMDRKQMRLARYETDEQGKNTIHGQLWKTTKMGSGTMFIKSVEVDNTQSSWNDFDTKYPDLEEVNPTDYETLSRAINFAGTAYDGLFSSQVGEYFDLPVVRDYMIFVQVLLAIDNTAKNIYWSCYDKQESAKLTLAVWDLDCTVGQDWTNTPFRPVDRVGPERKLGHSNNLFGRLDVVKNGFHDQLVERYHALRKTVLHTDSLTLRYTRLIDRMVHAGAAARESRRWSGDSDLGGHELDWDDERAYIADWLNRRLHYLDLNTYAPAAVECVTAPAAPASGGTYDLTGRRVDGRNLPPGIYVRGGRKVVVR